MCAAQHTDGAARSSIQATPGFRCQSGIPQNCGRKGRWRQPRKFDKSTNGPSLGRRLGPRHRQPRPLFCSSQLSEEHHLQPICQPCCHPVLPGSQSRVPARRGSLRLPSADKAFAKRVRSNGLDADPPHTTRDPGSGKNKKQRTAQDRFPLLNSVSEDPQRRWQRRSFRTTPGAFVHGPQNVTVEDCRSQPLQRSPESLFSPASEAVAALGSVPRHVLDCWTGLRGLCCSLLAKSSQYTHHGRQAES